MTLPLLQTANLPVRHASPVGPLRPASFDEILVTDWSLWVLDNGLVELPETVEKGQTVPVARSRLDTLQRVGGWELAGAAVQKARTLE